jgi:hypothetical protein
MHRLEDLRGVQPAAVLLDRFDHGLEQLAVQFGERCESGLRVKLRLGHGGKNDESGGA